MARKDGLWRQLGGFKINEVERARPQKIPNAKKHVSYMQPRYVKNF